jgi:hypothetical protein
MLPRHLYDHFCDKRLKRINQVKFRHITRHSIYARKSFANLALGDTNVGSTPSS